MMTFFLVVVFVDEGGLVQAFLTAFGGETVFRGRLAESKVLMIRILIIHHWMNNH